MADPAPCIYVLAGANGAGKSSVGAAMFRRAGVTPFNPDEAATRIRAAHPRFNQERANGLAWQQGRRLLERAIDERLTLAIETTLGGHTIAAMLEHALSSDLEVRIWFVGLSSPELHIARVRARVSKGGHDIPERMIRERYDRSRSNLIRLLPKATEVRVYDNSEEGDPAAGVAPQPFLVLHTREGVVKKACELQHVPQWAKPIVAAVLKRGLATRPKSRRLS